MSGGENHGLYKYRAYRMTIPVIVSRGKAMNMDHINPTE